MSMSTLACVIVSALLSAPNTLRPTEHDNLKAAPPPKAKQKTSSKGVSFEQRQRLEREVSDAIARLDLPMLDPPPGAAQAGPLVCMEPTVDFGIIWAGGTISHTFALENISDVAIEVYPIVACACPSGPKYSIPPHGTLELPISLRSEALHERFTKTIKVRIVKVGEPPLLSNLFEVQAARWLWKTAKPVAAALKRGWAPREE